MNEQNQGNNGWNPNIENQQQPNIPQGQMPQGQMPNNMGYPQSYQAQPGQGAPVEGSYQNYNNQQPYAQPFPYQQPAPKKKSGWMLGLGIGGVVIVAFLVLGILFVSGAFHPKTNAEKLWDAMVKTGEVTKSDTYQEWILDEIKGNESDSASQMYTNLLNGAGLKLRTKMDLNSNKLEGNLWLSLKNMDVLDATYQQQNGDFIFSIPKLLSKSIYFSKDSLNNLLEENGMTDTETIEAATNTFGMENVKASMKYLSKALDPKTLPEFKKLNKKKYLEKIRDYYDGKLTVEKGSRTLTVGEEEKEFKGEVYTIQENVADTVELYVQVVKDLAADENFRPFAEAYLDRLIGVIEENKDLLVYNYLQLFNGSPHLKTTWDEEVKSELIYTKELILDGIDKVAEELAKPHADAELAQALSALRDSGISLDVVFVVSKQQITYSYVGFTMDLQKAAESISQSDSPIQSITYHVASGVLGTGNDVKFADFKPEEAWDYTKATQEDMAKMLEEVQNNVLRLLGSMGLF